MTDLEAAISNTKQFNDYSKLNSDKILLERFGWIVEHEKKSIIFRLKEWRKDNIEYFTGGELCGIDHVINMLVAGKV